MLNLAKECQQLEIFTHVSTSYVNSNRRHYIEEEIYQPDQDPEIIARDIMQRSVQDVKMNEPKLIGDFPNTYTYTKNLAEKYLINNLGNIKCVILRPAIIACSL